MDIWSDWNLHYKRLGWDESAICRDGIIDQSLFDSAPLKLLFVLKETNDAKSLDLREYLRGPVKSQMWYAAARWAEAMFLALPPYTQLQNSTTLQTSLHRTAVINLKKLTGSGSANLSEVGAYALRDRELLRRQIREIGPEIILAGGTFEILCWLLELDVDPARLHTQPIYSESYRTWVIPCNHPARAGGEMKYLELVKLIQFSGDMFNWLHDKESMRSQ